MAHVTRGTKHNPALKGLPFSERWKRANPNFDASPYLLVQSNQQAALSTNHTKVYEIDPAVAAKQKAINRLRGK